MQPLSFKAFASPKALMMSTAKRSFFAGVEIALGSEGGPLEEDVDEPGGPAAALVGVHPSKYTRAPQWPHGSVSLPFSISTIKMAWLKHHPK